MYSADATLGMAHHRSGEGGLEELAHHRRQNDFVVRPQSVFFCGRTRAPNDEVVQIQRHIALLHGHGRKTALFSRFRSNRTPLSQRFSKRGENGREAHTSRRVVILDFRSSITLQS